LSSKKLNFLSVTNCDWQLEITSELRDEHCQRVSKRQKKSIPNGKRFSHLHFSFDVEKHNKRNRFCIERTLEKCSDVVYDYAYDDLSDAIEAKVNFWHHEKEDFERSEEACLPENRREMSKFDFISHRLFQLTV
jgi:hypothetical protein